MTRIPKVIHYCWFGQHQKPKSVEKYIKEWREKLPDYQIIEWNESNFDINCCNYVAQAYQAEKFAFVADYARLKALYEYGGIYLDTDVEVVKSFDQLIDTTDADLILGLEEKNWICTSTIISCQHNLFIKQFMDSYHKQSFFNKDNSINTTTNVVRITQMLFEFGFKQFNQRQYINTNNTRILILEAEYLSPMDYINRIDNRTVNTITIHHYDITWGKKKEFLIRFIKQSFVKLVGKKLATKFWKLIREN